jgi:hypothetical protein
MPERVQASDKKPLLTHPQQGLFCSTWNIEDRQIYAIKKPALRPAADCSEKTYARNAVSQAVMKNTY